MNPEKRELVKVTEECFFKAFGELRDGVRLGDIGAAVSEHAVRHGYGVVREMVGHGIGRNMHEPPDVPNYGVRGKGLRLTVGNTIAIEPMINLGSHKIKFMPDGWTVKTEDGKPSAHYENTVVITADGGLILTL